MGVVNDPIADMLTRIRNAGMSRRTETMMPSSKILIAIAKILQQEGYIRGWSVEAKKPVDELTVYLKYGNDRKHTIRDIRRISKPGLRVYAGKHEIPRVRNGLGIAIVSTPEGRDVRTRGAPSRSWRRDSLHGLLDSRKRQEGRTACPASDSGQSKYRRAWILALMPAWSRSKGQRANLRSK